MTTIITNRNISKLYPNLDVITESTISKSVDNILKLKAGVSFGVGGRMFRHAEVKLDATNLMSVTKGLKEHEEVILELIDIFEQALAWGRSRYAHANQHGESSEAVIFNKVLLQEHPVMVHGVHKGRNVEIQIYGSGILDVCIPLDTRHTRRFGLFVSRMEEIIETFRGHLRDVDQINYAVAMEGVK
ncbi:hypothetical protein D3C81_304810 [compost metagenome]